MKNCRQLIPSNLHHQPNLRQIQTRRIHASFHFSAISEALQDPRIISCSQPRWGKNQLNQLMQCPRYVDDIQQTSFARHVTNTAQLDYMATLPHFGKKLHMESAKLYLDCEDIDLKLWWVQIHQKRLKAEKTSMQTQILQMQGIDQRQQCLALASACCINPTNLKDFQVFFFAEWMYIPIKCSLSQWTLKQKFELYFPY